MEYYWHHQLNGLEFERARGDGEGQRSLVCCSPRCLKELDTTEYLNNNNRILSGLPFPTLGDLSDPFMIEMVQCNQPGWLIFSGNDATS